MNFEYPARALELAAQLGAFMRDEVGPRDADWQTSAREGIYPLAVVEDLKRKARDLKLWNLFLPSLGADQPGTCLSNLEYAPLAEITGRVPWSPEVFNCNAPDTGNMEILHLHATPEQRERWLAPLLRGEIRSCFSMTEPAIATNLIPQICRRRLSEKATAIGCAGGNGSRLGRSIRTVGFRSSWDAPISRGRASLISGIR